MKTPTLRQFHSFRRRYKSLAEAVVLATAHAQLETERVRAYIAPVLLAAQLKDENGEVITNSDLLYCCDDDAGCERFYDAADAAHRAHGFTGERGVWPDLQARTLQLEAEQALLGVGAAFMGIELTRVYGDTRKDMLKLLMDACLAE